MSETKTAPVPASLHADFCYIMDDDSMEGAGIRAGDIVAVVACDHAENGQIVAVQTDVICFDELPGAKIIGKAVEVRHFFKWAKEEAQEGQQ